MSLGETLLLILSSAVGLVIVALWVVGYIRFLRGERKQKYSKKLVRRGNKTSPQ